MGEKNNRGSAGIGSDAASRSSCSRRGDFRSSRDIGTLARHPSASVSPERVRMQYICASIRGGGLVGEGRLHYLKIDLLDDTAKG